MLLLLRTVRHLQARQILNRLTRRFAPEPLMGDAPPARMSEGTPTTRSFLPRPISCLGSGRFRFLNQERTVYPKDFGKRKDGLLWDYNFHYFDGLLAPLPDYDAKARWVEQWLAHVPVGSRPAWDPYPISRRVCNWIKWSLSSGSHELPGLLPSLASQVRHLERTLEYHLMANHLLANAVAITMAGAFFAGREGDGWLARGSALLEQQLDEQFLPDGAHFELSPIYHSVILEDLLDLMIVARRLGVRLPSVVESRVRSAADWLAHMIRPDGRVPLLNDAAYDQGPRAAEVLAQTERMLGPAPAPGDGLHYLEGSGYFRYRSGRLFVLGDVGQIGPSYQPGHAHCDMLSFELCWEDRPLIVDTGTSTYEISPRRSAERGTAAHNTVQLNGLEQTEIWAGFRVARRARVEDVVAEAGKISAQIRAFPAAWSRLHRDWRFSRGESMQIEDRILSNPAGLPATTRLHFHPDVKLAGRGDLWSAEGLQIRVEGALAVRNVEYLYAPEFNTLRTARCLEIDFDDHLLTQIHPIRSSHTKI